MIAIHTKYLSPTSTKGARIKAYCYGDLSVTIPFNYDLRDVEAHFEAVKALKEKYDATFWDISDMRCGTSADNTGYAFCFNYATI